MRLLVLGAGILGVIGIAARAFEAHGLIALPDMSEPRLRDFSSGTEIILLHALALLGLAGIASTLPRISTWAGALIFVGVVLFATPTIIYGLTSARTLIMLTPLGGVALMAGWALLAIGGALGVVAKKAEAS